MENRIGTCLAILGGLLYAIVLYYIARHLINLPARSAIPISVFIGIVQFFALRYWLLVGGGKKGNPK